MIILYLYLHNTPSDAVSSNCTIARDREGCRVSAQLDCIAENKGLKLSNAKTIVSNSLLAAESRHSVCVSPRDAVDTVWVPPSLSVCTNSPADPLPLASVFTVIYSVSSGFQGECCYQLYPWSVQIISVTLQTHATCFPSWLPAAELLKIVRVAYWKFCDEN